MYGQMAVKTNVSMDAVAIPNLGVEVGSVSYTHLDVYKRQHNLYFHEKRKKTVIFTGKI